MDIQQIDDDVIESGLGIPKDTQKRVAEIINAPLLYIPNVLKIQDKLGHIVPLAFNKAQMRLHAEIERQRAAGQPVRIIILKARQMGFSTAISGEFYYHTTTCPNINSAIIAHKADASTNIFNKQKLFYDLSPSFLQPMRKASNAKELIFANPSVSAKERKANPGLRSTIKIETAVNKDALRSATVHNVHCSEVAFWPYAEETMASVLQAVPNHPGTMVIIESTPNGVGGYFYEEWLKAERGESAFTPLFFPWFEHDEYRQPVPPDFVITDEERELKTRFGVDDKQLCWRRWCIKANCAGSLDTFHQEYPATPEEAFLASGRPVFDVAAIDKAMQATEPPVAQGRVVEEKVEGEGRVVFHTMYRGYLSIWKYPEDGEEYVIGGDVAKGLEHGDYSCAQVVQKRTAEVVAEWHGHLDADLFGLELTYLGRYYNMALLVPEENNHGIATINAIRRTNYPNLWKRRTVNKDSNRTLSEYGFWTDSKSKPLIINGLAGYLREGAGRIKSKATLQECLTYVYEDSGSTNARAGCYDDRVMALALALYGLSERPHVLTKFKAKLARELYGANGTTGY